MLKSQQRAQRDVLRRHMYKNLKFVHMSSPLIAYLLAYEMIHVTIRGFGLSRTMYVQSARHDEIKQALGFSLGLRNISVGTQVEFADHRKAEMNSDLGHHKEVAKPLVYKVHIYEKARFRVLVRSIDSKAIISSYDSAPNYFNRN